MIAAAGDVVAILDHTKWGKTAFATFCPTEGISRIITDRHAPADLIEQLATQGIATLRADASGSVGRAVDNARRGTAA